MPDDACSLTRAGSVVRVASHDPQVVARCERLIRLAGGRVASDIELSGGEPPASILRRVGQLG